MQFLLNEFHGKVKELLWGYQTTYQFANLQSGRSCHPKKIIMAGETNGINLRLTGLRSSVARLSAKAAEVREK
jgi:hypothetical protein